ncbi:hypothetical protein GCM10014713_50860 [Streptomyces purpureus]|uniref:Uncharacterized protein n=1 Tax=Streptomyces purpureus TaxID=1951 RepID=A0A918HC83_9ACTN|nr:hypothetical protein GCM10014713_50860 [Streptomyces purpureus]
MAPGRAWAGAAGAARCTEAASATLPRSATGTVGSGGASPGLGGDMGAAAARWTTGVGTGGAGRTGGIGAASGTGAALGLTSARCTTGAGPSPRPGTFDA